jgi:4,5-dihydroxyphthalate decarboxylase
MAKFKLTVACDKYDYLQPLRDGTVQAEGIDLNLITVESGIRHQRMYHHGEYDACEFSMSSYLVAKSQDVGWFHAIPFFPRRMFTHKFCFIRSGSGIKKPADLKGARIGLRSYENTLALITKGMFHNTYDPVTDVTWVITNKEPVGSKLPSSIKVEQVEGKWRLEDLLLQGKSMRRRSWTCPKRGFGAGVPWSGCSDFEQDERDYLPEGEDLPIMHPIIIKTDILKNDPWVPPACLRPSRHRRAYDEFMQQPHRLSFAWARSYLEEERKFFGKHPFYQGLKENHHDVQNMITFADQQGMLARSLTVEELFTENTRNT